MRIQQIIAGGFRQTLCRVAFAVLAIGVLSACGPIVRSDYDSQANLSKYRSFAWELGKDTRKGSDNPFYNPMNEKRLRDAVTRQLSSRGLQPTEERGSADVLVDVSMGTRQSFERDPTPVRWGFGFGWGRRGYGTGIGMSTDSGYYYREGRISLDLFDAKTREPIWHAYVDTDVTSLTGEDAQRRVDSAVEAMFAKLPKNL